MLGLLVAAASNAQPLTIAEIQREIWSANPGSGKVFTTIFRGRRLTYEIVDGMAIHAGDIVLGTAEEAAAASTGPEHPPSQAGSHDLTPRSASTANSERLWPDGIIPYEIDPAVYGTHPRQKQDIEAAIASWNELTVIRLVERSGETNYVQIVPTEDGNCSSSVGMIGGKQDIRVPPFGCPFSYMVHEIGHAVGFWHEHQREDRNNYITLEGQNLSVLSRPFDFTSFAPSFGPYNYASTMHYGTLVKKPRFVTIPPGIPIPSGGLSAGDIDAVAHLYGKPPRAVTVSTNPPGLNVIVDGLEVTAPHKVIWVEGSKHSIEAPLVQMTDSGQGRFVFARWSDPAERVRQVEASQESTWYEANYFEQRKPSVIIEYEPEAGSVEFEPASADGFYTVGSRIKATAIPNSTANNENQFLAWFTAQELAFGGRATNPLTIGIESQLSEITAYFTNLPFLHIRASADSGGPRVRLDNRSTLQLPANLILCPIGWDCPRPSVHIETPEVLEPRYEINRRYRFESWSNNAGRAQEIDLRRDAVEIAHEELTLHVSEDVRLGIDIFGNGAVSTVPESDDGFFPVGSMIQFQATPEDGWAFANWASYDEDNSPSQRFKISRPSRIGAVFTQSQLLQPGVEESFEKQRDKKSWHLYSGEEGYRVWVPPEAEELSISLETSPSYVDVDLLVRHRFDVWDVNDYAEQADHASVTGRGKERVRITRRSEPPLQPGTYYIAFVRQTGGSRFNGTVLAEISGNAPPPAELAVGNRSYSFVTTPSFDPAPQSVRLWNTGRSDLQYRVTPMSEATWLRWTPNQGFLVPRATVDVQVAAIPIGLPPNSHLRAEACVSWIRRDEPWTQPDPGNCLGRKIHVTFVVLPEQPLLRIGDDVTSPTLLHKVEPEYSEEAREARKQGTVVLVVEIWEDGLAHNIRVLESVGFGLDEKAIEAVKKWRFSPGMKDGRPVRVEARIQVRFRLI